ncbi:MAG: ECF transporter S component [Ignavibacteriales bacterium]|nr:ECF transporter S component [Ignavibacteriales bacterium]
MIRERIRSELSGPSLPLIAFAVALNLAVGQIAVALKIPFYLDSLGTILTAILIGPWAGMLTGCTANILAAAIGNPSLMFFVPVTLVIGSFTAFVARRGGFRAWWSSGLAGIVQGVLAATVSAPISAFVFGGTMLAGTDALVVFYRAMGHSLLQSVWYQGLSSDPIDKLVSYLVIYATIHRLPARIASRFPGMNWLVPQDRNIPHA